MAIGRMLLPFRLIDGGAPEAFGIETINQTNSMAPSMSIARTFSSVASRINRPFEEFSLQEYEDQIRVSSPAAFSLARAIAPSTKQKRYGRIINFRSLALNG